MSPSVSTAPLLLDLEARGWRRQQLIESSAVVGRGRDCDIELPDPTVSRRHCRLFPTAGGWSLEDLESSSGTLLDGRPVEGPTALEAGQVVVVGHSSLRIRRQGVSDDSDDSVVEASLAEPDGLLELVAGLDALASAEGLEELLETIVDRGLLAIDGDRGALLLGAGDDLEIAVARGRDGAELATDQLLARTLPKAAVSSGRAVVVTEASESDLESRWLESLFDRSLGSVVCVPLPGGDGPLGVLYVDRERPLGRARASQLALLEVLAARGSLAIERARQRQEELERLRRERETLEVENRRMRERSRRSEPVAEHRSMTDLLKTLRRVASAEATICLLGETGTGKEVLCRYIHDQSPRRDGPFVVVDCGALPANLIETELFGHEKGAFTGAAQRRRGKFRAANGGTLFLDEIGELPLELQPKLLRVLQEMQIQPIGSDAAVEVDVRVVCATHQDLEARVQAGRFREDLFYRVAVLSFTVPPLRDREEDILLLARHFVGQHAERGEEGQPALSHSAQQALLEHAWPGNVRELEKRIQRALLMREGPLLMRRDLGVGDAEEEGAADPRALLPLKEARAEASGRFERAYLEQLLTQSRGSVTEAARLAGVSRGLLHRLIKKHGLDARSFVPGSSL